MLKTIWNNRKQILEGINNSIFKTEEIEEVAKARMEVCQTCDFVDNTGDSCLIPGTQPCCAACGCKLYLKTRCLSADCAHPGGSKWPAYLHEDEEDKLYTELDYNPDDE